MNYGSRSPASRPCTSKTSPGDSAASPCPMRWRESTAAPHTKRVGSSCFPRRRYPQTRAPAQDGGTTCTRRTSRRPSSRRYDGRESASLPVPTRSGTPSARICWSRVTTSGPCRNSWDTRTYARRRSAPTFSTADPMAWRAPCPRSTCKTGAREPGLHEAS